MAAQLVSLGKLVVPAAGTPVALQTIIPASLTLPTVHAFLVTVIPANTGKVYVGIAGLNRTTLVNAITILAVPSINSLPTFSCAVTAAANALSLPDLWFDVDNGGDGVLVSAIVW